MMKNKMLYTEQEYENDAIPDFVEYGENCIYDYDGERIHRYDEYNGELTAEIALVKFERLLRSLAQKYAGRGAEYDELFQLAQIELVRLIEKYKGEPFFINIIKRRLIRYISYWAKQIRKTERQDCRAPFELLEKVTVESTYGDWLTREKTMFAKLKKPLDKSEIKLVTLLYGGASQRQAAERLRVSHSAIQKRLEKIRAKLTPLVPWLEDRAEFPCTNRADETLFA